MIKHFLRITMAVLVMSIFIFLPYFPGDYDAMVITLSTFVQVLAMSGLLFVPVGIIWLMYELLKRKNVTYRFAITSLIIFCFVGIFSTIGAFVNSPSFGFIVLVVFIYLFKIFFSRIKQIRNNGDRNFNPTPCYLIFIPVLVVFIRFLFIDFATDFSRNTAIKHSEQLIKAIELYQEKNNHYPLSLLSLWEDYKPSIIGIKRFYYEPHGTTYNLYFEQFATELSVQEIVMYNKLDEHQFSSHNSDLLVLTPEQINLQRGYFGKYDLPTPHWKYFWFD